MVILHWQGSARRIQRPRLSTQSITIQQNTASFLSAIAQSIQWQPGDKIIIFDNEYPSTCFPFMKCADMGVEIIVKSYQDFLDS